MTPPTPSRLTVPALCALLALSPAFAATDTWREPELEPFRGPSILTFTPEALARADDRLGKRSRRRMNGFMPRVDVRVRDEAGRPASGIGVTLRARTGRKKNERDELFSEGATGQDGHVLIPGGPLPGLRDITLRFKWAEGYQDVQVRMKMDDRRWKFDGVQYWNVLDNEKQGNCRNLVNLEQFSERDGGVALQLDFTKPDSLLGCQAVAYGPDKKRKTFAHLDAIGARRLNRGDKNFFGVSEEQAMALEVSKAVEQQFEIYDDPQIEGYLQDMLDRLIAASDEPERDVRVRLIHTDAINAFATAGGNVYVFTGLIEAAETEAQLAGVLAHELTHVLSRHVTEGMTRGMKLQFGSALAAIGLGTAADLSSGQQRALLQGSMLGAGLLGMKYTRRAETEADLLGMQYLWKAGWDPEGLPQFFAVLEERHPNQVPGWLSDHPTHDRRVKNGVHWSRAFLPQSDRYLVSSARFERIQRRVAALPPPKKQAGGAEGASFQSLLESSPTFQHHVHGTVGGFIDALLGGGERR